MKVHLLFIFVVLIFSGCLRKPLEPLEVRRALVEPECFQYFGAFNEGSEYVYEREEDGALDTTKVTSYSYGNSIEDSLKDEAIIIYKQVIDIRYSSQIYPSFRTRIQTYDPQHFVFTMMYGSSTTQSFEKKDGVYTGRYSPSSFYKIDSLKVLNNTFYDVLVYIEPQPYPFQEIYFVKNIGIVKKKMLDRKVYLLKSWNLNLKHQ